MDNNSSKIRMTDIRNLEIRMRTFKIMMKENFEIWMNESKEMRMNNYLELNMDEN